MMVSLVQSPPEMDASGASSSKGSSTSRPPWCFGPLALSDGLIDRCADEVAQGVDAVLLDLQQTIRARIVEGVVGVLRCSKGAAAGAASVGASPHLSLKAPCAKPPSGTVAAFSSSPVLPIGIVPSQSAWQADSHEGAGTQVCAWPSLGSGGEPAVPAAKVSDMCLESAPETPLSCRPGSPRVRKEKMLSNFSERLQQSDSHGDPTTTDGSMTRKSTDTEFTFVRQRLDSMSSELVELGDSFVRPAAKPPPIEVPQSGPQSPHGRLSEGSGSSCSVGAEQPPKWRSLSKQRGGFLARSSTAKSALSAKSSGSRADADKLFSLNQLEDTVVAQLRTNWMTPKSVCSVGSRTKVDQTSTGESPATSTPPIFRRQQGATVQQILQPQQQQKQKQELAPAMAPWSRFSPQVGNRSSFPTSLQFQSFFEDVPLRMGRRAKTLSAAMSIFPAQASGYHENGEPVERLSRAVDKKNAEIADMARKRTTSATSATSATVPGSLEDEAAAITNSVESMPLWLDAMGMCRVSSDKSPRRAPPEARRARKSQPTMPEADASEAQERAELRDQKSIETLPAHFGSSRFVWRRIRQTMITLALAAIAVFWVHGTVEAVLWSTKQDGGGFPLHRLGDVAFALGTFLAAMQVRRIQRAEILGEPGTMLADYAEQQSFRNTWIETSRAQGCFGLLLWISTIMVRAGFAFLGWNSNNGDASPTHSWLNLNPSSVAALLADAVVSFAFIAMVLCLLHVTNAHILMIDQYCVHFTDNPDVELNAKEWNIVQAMLHQSSKALSPCFVIIHTTGFCALLLNIGEAILGTPAELLPWLSTTVRASLLLGFMSCLTVRAAEVTGRCTRVPVFLNSFELPLESRLVEFVIHSNAGFHIFQVRLTMFSALKVIYSIIVLTTTIVTKVVADSGHGFF